MGRARSMSRVRALVPAVLAGLLLASAPSGSSEDSLPVVSTWTREDCGNAASASGAGRCDVAAAASADARAVAADTRLVSPLDGTVAWNARAVGDSQVVATYELTEPAPRLDFVIRMRIGKASATIGEDAPTDLLGDSDVARIVRMYQHFLVDSHLGRSAYVVAFANAQHSDCFDCGGGTSQNLLYAWEPGTITLSGEEIVVRLKVSRAGGLLPPGEVSVRAGVGAVVNQSRAWGDDAASVTATVTSISLEE